MTKSSIILLTVLWLICTAYLGVARLNGYPYQTAAIIGSWGASALLLIAIIVFIRKHRDRKKG
jgi:hypothetical protein